MLKINEYEIEMEFLMQSLNEQESPRKKIDVIIPRFYQIGSENNGCFKTGTMSWIK